jgi:hypothetical protein
MELSYPLAGLCLKVVEARHLDSPFAGFEPPVIDQDREEQRRSDLRSKVLETGELAIAENQ